MKRLVLIFVLCQLAYMPAVATFDMDDPQQTLEEFQATSNTGSSNNHGDLIALNKSDYLKLIVGTYVHGFNEFDTTIQTSDQLVEVGIYFDPENQDKGRAEQLAAQFRKQLPLILGEPRYSWASDVEIEVSVHHSN